MEKQMFPNSRQTQVQNLAPFKLVLRKSTECSVCLALAVSKRVSKEVMVQGKWEHLETPFTRYFI